MIEKKLRGLVQERPSRNFRAPANFDKTAFHQCLQNPIDGDAADGLDIGARDRLAIGDDSERFERGRGQARRFRRGKKLAHPIGIRGIGRELPPFGFFNQLKSALLLAVFDFQFFDRSGHFGLADLGEFVRRKLIDLASALDNIDHLFCGERFLRAEE